MTAAYPLTQDDIDAWNRYGGMKEFARLRCEVERLGGDLVPPCPQYTDGIHRGGYPDGQCACGMRLSSPTNDPTVSAD